MRGRGQSGTRGPGHAALVPCRHADGGDQPHPYGEVGDVGPQHLWKHGLDKCTIMMEMAYPHTTSKPPVIKGPFPPAAHAVAASEARCRSGAQQRHPPIPPG